MDNIAAVLAELEEERRRLWAELARVERIIAVIEDLALPTPRIAIAASPGAALSPPEELALSSTATPPSANPSPYARLDVYEATAAYLIESGGRPKTSRQIADALVAGGFPTRSRYFCNVIGTMLRRRDATRPHRISVTADGKRWFVRKRQKAARTAPKHTPA
jgi:hypothetical protein